MKYLIKNGNVVDPSIGLNKELDILIEDGMITEISDSIEENKADKVYHVKGCVVAPGFVDLHAHLREPGGERAETIETGAMSAMNGGFTHICAMPNTSPCMDNAAIISLVLDKAKTAGYAEVLPVGAVSKKREGKELASIGEMVEKGIVAVSDDGLPVATSDLVKKALEYCIPFGIPLMEHAEDLTLTKKAVMNEGFYSTKLGLRGIPSIAEDIIVARDIIVNSYVKGWLHIQHLSTEYSLNLVREAKNRGERVTCEVTPHHLFLNDSYLESFDTNYIMKPPLRSENDRLALIEGIKDGTIDAIATDHAPHPNEYKNCEIDIAAFGIIGFETAIPVILDLLHHKHGISIKRIVELMSINPAKIVKLEEGRIMEGKKADLTIFNPDKEVIINPSYFKSKARNTPFKGLKLKGSPVLTVLGERVVECKVGD